MSRPSKRIVPAVGLSCSRISFEVVVLPQPDSPITPRVSPASTAKSMPSTALTQPTRRRGNAEVTTGKYLATASTSSSGGDMNGLFRCGLLFGEPAPHRPRCTDPALAWLVVGAAGHRLGAT